MWTSSSFICDSRLEFSAATVTDEMLSRGGVGLLAILDWTEGAEKFVLKVEKGATVSHFKYW
jgi:hypothetical protein